MRESHLNMTSRAIRTGITPEQLRGIYLEVADKLADNWLDKTHLLVRMFEAAAEDLPKRLEAGMGSRRRGYGRSRLERMVDKSIAAS